jgi:hypothetical protein
MLLYMGVSQPFQNASEIRQMSFMALAGVRNRVPGKRKNVHRHKEGDILII